MRNTLLVLAALAALSCRATFGADAEGSFERTLNVTGPVDLDVQTGSGRIEVRAGSASAVVIRATIRVREGFFRVAKRRTACARHWIPSAHSAERKCDPDRAHGGSRAAPPSVHRV